MKPGRVAAEAFAKEPSTAANIGAVAEVVSHWGLTFRPGDPGGSGSQGGVGPDTPLMLARMRQEARAEPEATIQPSRIIKMLMRFMKGHTKKRPPGERFI